MRVRIIIAAAAATVLFSAPAAEAWPNLVVNGGFSLSSYSGSSQFGTPYGGQGVTGWTGGSGYQVYFVGNTSTTVAAANQWGSSSEKLYGAAGGDISPDGGNFVALDGDPTSGVQGSISQTVTGLVFGQQYQLTFNWGAGQMQSRTGATTEKVQVTFGSDTATTGVVSNASMSFAGWVSQSFTFTATATSEVLTFLAIGTPVNYPPIVTLDGISLSLVPEPMSVLMLGAGLCGLVAVRRTRRS
jgi:hypothetical protein